MSDRRTELAAIHAKRNKLRMDEETYRTLVREVGQVASGSAADLDAEGRRRVLDRLSELEGPRSRRRHPGAAGHGKDGLLSKIEAQLTSMGAEWAYADGIARHMFRRDSVRFCTPEQLRAVVAALAVEQEKRELLATVDHHLKEMGLDRGYAATVGLRTGWERHRSSLRALALHLSEKRAEKDAQ